MSIFRMQNEYICRRQIARDEQVTEPDGTIFPGVWQNAAKVDSTTTDAYETPTNIYCNIYDFAR